MKKLLLLLTCLVGSNSWSACTYNFDATQAQLDTYFKMDPSFSFYPQISGQKFGFKLLSVSPAGTYKRHIATSKAYLDLAIAKRTSTQTNLSLGDKILPPSGIIAYEFNFKVPDNLASNGLLQFWPVEIIGNLENGNYGLAIYYNNGSTIGGKSGNNFVVGFSTNDSTTLKTMEPFNVTNSAQTQKLGIYINQDSHQIGMIANGQNLGYVYSLPSKAKNIAFNISSAYGNIQPADLNKEVSIELVTDKSKFTNAFPTGTTDICGN